MAWDYDGYKVVRLNFDGKYEFDRAYKMLLKEIGIMGKLEKHRQEITGKIRNALKQTTNITL